MLPRAYDDELDVSTNEILHADPSEIPTIELMLRGILSLEQFSSPDMRDWLGIENPRQDGVTMAIRMRNFASYVAHEETFQAEGPPNEAGESVRQKVLCITKGWNGHLQEGSWSSCMKQKPGFRPTT
jgi:hypothetical protein